MPFILHRNLYKMTSQVTYTMVMNVNMSWDALKLMLDYKKIAGHMIFTRLFELEPQAWQLFGFGPKAKIGQLLRYRKNQFLKAA